MTQTKQPPINPERFIRGRERVGWAFTFAATAYNLTRLPKLLAAMA